MSAHYYDGYDEEDYRWPDYDLGEWSDEDEEMWTCAFPGNCCMAFTDHMRDECHTPEMAAEYMSGEE